MMLKYKHDQPHILSNSVKNPGNSTKTNSWAPPFWTQTQLALEVWRHSVQALYWTPLWHCVNKREPSIISEQKHVYEYYSTGGPNNTKCYWNG